MGIYDPGADAAQRYPHFTIRSWPLVAAKALVLPARGLILLSDRLDRAGKRCSLAHEIVHLDHGHDSCAAPVLEARQEARCGRETARRLIALPDLRDALRGAHCLDEVAWSLVVDRETLDERLRTLAPRDRRLLAQSRMALEGIA